MKRWIQGLCMIMLLLGLSEHRLHAQAPTRLKDVKKIYVTPLEGINDQGVFNMLQTKLVSALSKIPGISVVEEPENADAILTGSGRLENIGGNGHLYLQGGMRLFSRDEGVVLWADNIASSRFVRSVSSSFADNLAKSLDRALNGQSK